MKTTVSFLRRTLLPVRAGPLTRTVRMDWRGGLRYPRLERVAGTKDRIAALLARR